MGDNERQIIRNEETVVAGESEQTTLSQTETTSGQPVTGPTGAPVVMPTNAVSANTVETTTTTAPTDQMVAHNVRETVVDPAAEKSAAVDWVSRLVWFIAGLMAILLAIRFVLLAAGANESAGFAQLMYGLTDWMVAPFTGLFGRSITYPGAAGTGVLEWESLVAIVVYLLIAWLLTKLAQLLLGTNRTTSTVYSETDRDKRL